MKTWTVLSLLALLAAAAGADDPPTPTTRPDSRPADPEQERIDKVLAEQEAAGKKLSTLSADLIYEKEDVFGDVVKKTGRFQYRKPRQFRIDLDFRFVGKRKLVEDKAYIFDGKRLYLIDKRRKRLTIFSLPPPKPGAAPANPLELGRGPFPMPFGQKAETIRKLFEVKLIPPTDDEKKAGLTHLRLTPKKGTPLAKKYKRVDFWFDGELKLPLKLRYLDVGENKVTVTFPKKSVKVNDPKITPETFAEPTVNPADWTVIREPL